MKWSDGQPLTAEDVAYTINRSREEEWLNHSSTTGNLTATATSPTDGRDQVEGAGPEAADDGRLHRPEAHLREVRRQGRSRSTTARRTSARGPYHARRVQEGPVRALQGEPELLGRQAGGRRGRDPDFNNADAMVAALKRGEIDFVQDVPDGAFLNLQKDPDFVTRPGPARAASTSSRINGGDGLKKAAPGAAATRRCARRSRTRSTRRRSSTACCAGSASRPRRSSPSANPAWIPDIPEDQQFDFDLDKAKQILDDAGYKDTDGDGIREMPGGGQPLKFRYAVRSESPTLAADRRVHHRLAEGDRDRDDPEGLRRRPADRADRQGRLRHVRLGLDPVRRPRPDAVVLHLRPGQLRIPDDPTNYYNDANLCDPEYDKLYKEQKTELDPDKRMEIVHEMLTRFYEHGGLPAALLRRATCRPTARTSSRAGSSSRRTPGRCCSRTRRRATDAEARVGDDRRGAVAAAVTTAAAAAPG